MHLFQVVFMLKFVFSNFLYQVLKSIHDVILKITVEFKAFVKFRDFFLGNRDQ